MININGIDIDFNITSPLDIQRYKQAGERMEAEAAALDLPEVAVDDPAFLDAYIDMLNAELRLYGNFLDEVFGDGIAEKLLGNNPGLDTIADINNALDKALEIQGNDFGAKLKHYTPNRATRRAQK